ncbi:MAG: hypothetical protein V7L31_18540 [Nostoc sp.]|uniref:hypothetical protein n=1 Tax=Nostoc sp. TaxID=1180 RepID=UPI002FEE741A
MSQQALSQRPESLPAHLFIKLFEQVIERLAVKKSKNEIARFLDAIPRVST